MTTLSPSVQVVTQHPDYPKVRDAAYLARDVIGGACGELLFHDLDDWCKGGWKFDARGTGPKVADDLIARHHARTLGRTRP